MTEEIKLTDLKPDEHNANRGTERGQYMVEQSVRKLGAGRSLLVDRNGKLIAGNKTQEAAINAGIEDAVLIRTKGDKFVVVMREDLDLDDPTGQARELAYVDNRTGQVGLDFDPDVIAADLAAGLDLGDWWQDWEIEQIEYAPESPVDYTEEWQEDYNHDNLDAARMIKVHFVSNADAKKFADLLGVSITEDTKSFWYPARPEGLISQIIHESE